MAGMITWHELFTTDIERAIAFYTELLGAEIESASMGDFDYQMLNKDGRSHAGFVKDEQGVAPSHWYPYIHSDDVDASVQAATAAGAQLIHGPTDVADMLRFAVLALAIQTDAIGVPWLAYCLFWLAGSCVTTRRTETWPG